MLDLYDILIGLTILGLLLGTVCMLFAIRSGRHDRCPSCHEVGLQLDADSGTWTCPHCGATSDSGLAPLAHGNRMGFVLAWICLLAPWLMWLIMYLVVMVQWESA